MVVDVSEQVVVITGASRGIGRELARIFAEEKAKVVLNYYQNEESAKRLMDELSLKNENCTMIRADIKKRSEVSSMFQHIISVYGRVDVLINNAGVCADYVLEAMPLENWQDVIDVNLTGTFLCCREVAKIMIKQKSGKIINIASLKGQEGSATQVNYSASKAGVIALTKSIAKELGKYQISVNAICPGFIQTDLNCNNKNKKNAAELRSVLPINYALEDLINMILLLASDRIKGISGRVFNLDSRIV